MELDIRPTKRHQFSKNLLDILYIRLNFPTVAIELILVNMEIDENNSFIMN